MRSCTSVSTLRSGARPAIAAALAVLAGCGSSSPLDQPGWHQGVVEHDDRELGFELSGTVAAVLVARGAQVERGQEVAALDERLEAAVIVVQEAEVRAAEARLALLRAGSRPQEIAAARAAAAATAVEAEVARAELARVRGVAAQQASSQSAVDEARARASATGSEQAAAEQRLSLAIEGARPEELAAAQAGLDAAQAALALERERLARHHLRAPIAGRVLDVALDPGESALPGRTVVLVADTLHPYVDAYVPEAGLAALAIGSAAQVRVDGDARGYAAVVEDIGRRLEFTPRFLFSPGERPNLVMRVRVRVEDPDERLHAGVPAAVRFGPAAP